jgi:hypothetical protein
MSIWSPSESILTVEATGSGAGTRTPGGPLAPDGVADSIAGEGLGSVAGDAGVATFAQPTPTATTMEDENMRKSGACRGPRTWVGRMARSAG